MGYCSNIYKEKQERAAQSNSVTTKNNTPSQTNPKTVQAQTNRGASLLNPIEDLVSAAHEVAPQLPQMALDFGKSAVNNFTKQGLANTPAAIARGVASGAVDFVPSVAGLGVDLVNSIAGKDVITMPEERRRPLGTALEQWRDMQETSNNLAIPVVQGQNPANFGIKPVNNIMQTIAGSNEGADKAQFAEMMGQFAVPMGVANQAKNAAIAAKTATKVANEGSRIASKLSDAQKVKYANQIKKMAESNVAKNVVPKTPMSNLVDNVATGGALGMLEGNNLQERFQNGIGGAALGGALTGVHAGAKKIANSKKGIEIKNNIKDTFNKLTNEYDGLSKTVAGIDNALNTNLSENANDLTKIRKEYGKLRAKDQNYKRNISDEERQLLDEAGDLTEAQQTEIFERNKYGARERALRLSQEAKDKLVEQQEQKHSTTTKSKEESEQWWKDAEEREKALAEERARQEEIDKQELVNKLKQSKEAWEKQKNDNNSTEDLSHVKSEADINTPDNSKTLNPEQRTVSQDKITKLESGKAEGSDSNFYYEQKAKPKTKQIDADDAYIKPDENGQYVKEAQGQNYENYVDENYTNSDLLPDDVASLQKEIDAVKGQKDVPVVRSEANIKHKTPAQRMAERLHNERSQRAWKNHLKNKKVKSLNDETNEKSMADIIFGQEGYKENIEGSVPKMKSARAAEVRPTDKVQLYEGKLQASNKAEFRDPNTLEEVKINKTNSNEGTTFEERINKIVAEKEAKASKRIENANRTISDNLGLSSYSRTTSNGKRQYSNKITTVKLKDVIKGNAELEKYFKKIGDIDVHIADTPHPEGINGTYDFKTNSITLFTDATDLANTIAHEARHAVQNQIIKNTWFGSRWRKLYKSCERRNEVLLKFAANPKKMTIVEKVEPVYNDYKNKNISPDEFKQKVSEYELGVFRDFYKLYKDYRNTYLEVDARRFANGEHDKRLFHKGEATIRSELRTSKSKYSRDDKTRYGLNDFRDMSGQQMDSGDGISDLGKGQGSESDGIAGRHESTGRTEESVQREVNQNKLIHKTLNWFDKTKDKHTKFYHEFLEAAPEIKKFTDAYKTINDKREAFFREFGTYTDERMKARLFKQSKSGEGVYFQQGTKRSDKVEWGKESNEKVGFTGKKQLEGISKKGTTQEGLARGFSDVVRMEHTRNCINFLKENFGEQREGFVPVNSKLLANAMYFGKSKAWYETIRKGKEAIDNTFDENNAKEWNELYRTTEADKSDIYLPEDLLDLSITGEKELPLDYLSTYGEMRGIKGKIKSMAKVAGAMLEFYTDRFKRKVLTSASFFANNRFGNQIMLAMTADKPQDYIKGIADALRLKESEVPSEILESTLAEAIQKEANSGIRKYFSEKNNTFDKIARILNGDEIDTKTLSGLSKTTAKASNWIISKPNALFRSLSKLTGEINERFERFERKQAFSQSLSQMQRQKILKNARQFAGLHELAEVAKNDKLIREAVIDKVADALGDYNNFSKFEKNVLKKIIPFYAWNRTITRHIIHLAKENPVKATLVAYETYRLLHQDDGLEDYQHGSLKLGMRNDRTKSDVVINKASMIPYNTLFDMVSCENIGSFSPLITKPVEAIRGEKFFKPASEITSKNWKRTTQNKKEGYVNTKTGEFREGKAPISSRAGYIAKDAMETVYPMAGSPMTKGIPDAIKHYNETGEFLFPDKQYDASLGGFYHGDKAGKKKVGKKIKDRTLSAKNRLDLKYQIANRTLGLGIQPEHKVNSKEQKEKYQRQRKRMRGN